MSVVLLDTNAFLWSVFEVERLSAKAATLFEDRAVTKVLSLVSLWEIVIKVQLGKLALGTTVRTFFDEQVLTRELELLPIEVEHLTAYHDLPLHHRDPFDRLLIAQAKVRDLPVVTADPVFSRYGVHVTWDKAQELPFESPSRTDI